MVRSWLRSLIRKSLPVRRVSRSLTARRFRPAIEALEDRAVPATHFLLSALTAPATAGTAAQLSVTAVNNDGATDTSYLGTIQFTSSDGQAVLPADSALANGTGIFSATLFKAGMASVLATDTVNSNIAGQANISVNAAATAQLQVTSAATAMTAGVPATVIVTAEDAFGNVTSGYTGTVHFASSDSQAVLPADSSLINGSRTFKVTLNSIGTQTLTATDTIDGGITGSLCNIPQTAAVFSQDPNPAGGLDKSSWYPPDGMDGDQYVWDSFALNSTQSIGEIHWRGGYSYSALGFGSSPVSDFTIALYASIGAGSQPNILTRPIVQYSVGGNANETAAGTFGGVAMFDYKFVLPTTFQAVAGTRYWLQIEASQGIAPSTSWPPDWGLAYGSGGDNAHFVEIIGGSLAGGNRYYSQQNDIAFSLVTSANASGVVVNPAIQLGALSMGEWTAGRAGYSGVLPVGGGIGGFSGLRVTGLPAGIHAALNGNAVTLSGTPTTAGTYTLALSLRDSVGTTASRSYAFTVDPATTLAWTGLGKDNLWTNAANWTGAAPTAGNTLVFGATALQKTNVNNLAANTLLKSIVIKGNGYALSGNAIRLSGGITATSAGNGTNSIAFNMALTANQTFSVNGSADFLQLRGAINGSPFAITKTGTGTLLVNNGSNTFAGITKLSAGTVGGTGKVGLLTASAGSNLAPGTGGPGTLTSGNLTLAAGSLFNVDIGGKTTVSADQVNVIGKVNLGGSVLRVNRTFHTVAGAVFTLIKNDGTDPVVGTFAGLPEGATLQAGNAIFKISYKGGTGNDVVLTQIATVTRFLISAAPALVAAGSPFSITVMALDARNHVVPGYRGAVTCTTTDTGTGVVLPARYTFTAADKGVHTFAGTKLTTPGSWTITATDSANGLTGTSGNIAVS